MGLDATTLPDHFLEKLFPEERKRLGKAGMTAAEAQEKYQARVEKEMRLHFSNWLMLRAIPFVTARHDKKSTIMVGWPDYTVLWDNRVLCVEFKMAGQKPRPEQQKVIEFLLRSGVKTVVCTSFSQAIQTVKTHFEL
jgi:VRR-NUC domain